MLLMVVLLVMGLVMMGLLVLVLMLLLLMVLLLLLMVLLLLLMMGLMVRLVVMMSAVMRSRGRHYLLLTTGTGNLRHTSGSNKQLATGLCDQMSLITGVNTSRRRTGSRRNRWRRWHTLTVSAGRGNGSLRCRLQSRLQLFGVSR
jgi:hypothetical protein